ncbi:MAG: pantoate--beta-alanine ligase [Hyphomicrobiales bacterium]|nr:pantoate--beta-alanine ligase [Hyphomicrobiales bacterium]
MKICTDAAALHRALARLNRQARALVPTMGHVHEGHLALLRAARKRAPLTIASLYVNPLQFGAGEDFAAYPRTFDADCEAFARAGCDILFCPQERDIYPQGAAAEPVIRSGAKGRMLEGAVRPGHFDGVLTVLNRLFQLVAPSHALFGAKDFQQQFLVRRFAARAFPDLQIVTIPTARTAAGLALSSRHAYLDAAQLARAEAFFPILQELAAQVQRHKGRFVAHANDAKRQLKAAGLAPDYVAIRTADTLDAPRRGCAAGTALVALAAVRLGTTRLLDNLSFAL